MSDPAPDSQAAADVEQAPLPWRGIIAGLVVLAILSAVTSLWILRRDSHDTAATPAPRTQTTVSAPTPDEPPKEPGESSKSRAERDITESDDAILPELGNRGYDVSHYDIDLDWQAPTLDGVATITLVPTEPLTEVSFDLVDLKVSSARVDGATVKARQVGNEVIVALPRRLAVDETANVTLSYSGTPGTEDQWNGWHTGKWGVVAIGEPRNTSFWAPSNDHPADKATYDVSITAPPGSNAVFNATPDEATKALVSAAPDDDSHRFEFHDREPRASYLNLLMIGDYRWVDAGTSPGGVPIRHVLPTSKVDDYLPQLEKVGPIVDRLSEWFGDYPFGEYGVAVPAGFRLPGAIETQTLSLHDPSALTSGILTHEAAHQWFGNSVSLEQWNDIWLNEGFATYAEFLSQSSPASTTKPGDMADLSGATKSTDLATAPLAVGPDDIFGAVSYYRGALTLQALRLTIGEEPFRRLIRRWAADHRNANANTADFEQLAEEVSGQQLDDLFDKWLRQDPLPALPSKQGEQ